MKRRCKNWIETYMKYVHDTESPSIYHKWCAISAISSVLQKKCHLKLGRINVYPNMYIILCGPPGARKSEAIKYCKGVLKNIETMRMSSNSTTVQAFIQDIAASEQDYYLQGTDHIFTHASLSVISSELEIFLKQKSVNHDMLAILTDLYDASEEDWSARTKHSGDDCIPSVFISLLAATTPESLALILPIGAVGSGFTSRIIFVHAKGRGKKIAIPDDGDYLVSLEENLIVDLQQISSLCGVYRFDRRGKNFWLSWYDQYDEHSNKKICLDPSFTYWYERKPMHILKIAQAIAASESDEMIVNDSHLIESLKYIEEVEEGMGRSFVALGRSSVTAEIDIVTKIIAREEMISEPSLLSILTHEMDIKTFDSVIDQVIRSGKVKRIHPAGIDKSLIYAWIPEEERKKKRRKQ